MPIPNQMEVVPDFVPQHNVVAPSHILSNDNNPPMPQGSPSSSAVPPMISQASTSTTTFNSLPKVSSSSNLAGTNVPPPMTHQQTPPQSNQIPQPLVSETKVVLPPYQGSQIPKPAAVLIPGLNIVAPAFARASTVQTSVISLFLFLLLQSLHSLEQ